MRIVFVNHAHPDLPHVSGMRMGLFSRAMSARGHEVVLLTCAMAGVEDPSTKTTTFSARLASHAWNTPLTVAVSPLRGSNLPTVPRVLSRAATLWRFVRHSGVHVEWTQAAKPWAKELAARFRPDVVWGTFGNTSNLSVAQAVAHAAGCPWIIDVKDSWATFLRPGVRELMAWRFRDASAYTSNAQHHQKIAAQWLRQTRSTVIYSGVADSFIDHSSTIETLPSQLMLIGSTYEPATLRSFLQAVKTWASSLLQTDRNTLAFVYAGCDHGRVSEAIHEVGLPMEVEVLPHLPVDKLAERCQRSFVNCYLWAEFGFHHKLLELLACGRPVISFPGEAAESRQLASSSATSFSACSRPADLGAALSRAWAVRNQPAADNGDRPWRWSDRVGGLEGIFEEVTGAAS